MPLTDNQAEERASMYFYDPLRHPADGSDPDAYSPDRCVCVFPTDEFEMTPEAWLLIVAEWKRRRGDSGPLGLDDIREVLSRANQ